MPNIACKSISCDCNWKRAFVSLGSNIEPRLRHLQSAVQMLLQVDGVRLISASSVYETEPVEVAEPQMAYLNAVVEVATRLTPMELFAAMQSIELRLGRMPNSKGKKLPRTVDLDLLIYDETEMDTEALKLPHPRMSERAFVLIPLCEISPKLKLPNGINVCERAMELSRRQRVVQRFKPDQWLKLVNESG
ncbi:MAG: 2-amino-4-hydroxy-6-hydroxymethyldihydropteridine diphosphokinase [Armatimonadota bacterium]|nr:2-amino-4-hydroxy-6-hydroxymethyldihydropteridine diphosphokinase [Armatimonadota bacterium]MCX7777749.1 2-amino-4-hydroxy-6-hydroxymethyldihydropteridine diphosphokinase [Armatimonadota bacterium]MDW8026197.1 2-amino-4-hydroxy-6-hydroxymethyldihydropteridine diphosphokinase [Armatimonadota bacterium]